MTLNVVENRGLILQKLAIMEQDKNILKRIRMLQNEIATNLLYYTKNREELEHKYKKACVSDETKDIMFDAMELRKQIADDLLIKLDQFTKEYQFATMIKIKTEKKENGIVIK